MKKIILCSFIMFISLFKIVGYAFSLWYTFNEPGGNTGWWWYRDYIEMTENKTFLGNKTSIGKDRQEKK
ncbi:MAG: hypothetical protein QXT86_12345, partial [Archaeoglobaceae archaeon]